VITYVLGERDHVANLANVAALLWKEYNDARGPGAVNWVGFYLSASEEQRRRKELKLGPFVGKPAVTRIPFSRGVCGAAARSACTKVWLDVCMPRRCLEHDMQLVKDVHEFEGHIACDEASQSEIVVPLLADDGSVLGVLDMDCPTVINCLLRMPCILSYVCV
jgi:putative methionine-R-sulfoxide reductase with GAF domain